MLRALVCVLLVGCETHPSILDGVGGGIDHRTQTWRAIEARAEPMSARLDLLRSATRGPRTTPAELQQRGDELIAWMDAGGTVPPPPLMSAFSDVGVDGTLGLVRESLAARPADDRMLEAALYVASRLRQDGTGMLGGLVASAITKQIATARPTAPSFAARYAPTDAEVFRIFASEAVFARRASMEVREDGLLAVHEQLAGVPLERAAYLAALRSDQMFGPLAQQLFDAVDAYQAWLGVK